MKSKYPSIRYFFSTVLSNQSGLSAEQADRAMHNSLNFQEELSSFQKELPIILSDPDIDWRDWMTNDDYEIDDNPQSYDEFRCLIVRYIWNAVFPGVEPPPKPDGF